MNSNKLRLAEVNAQDNPVRGENMDNEKDDAEHLGSSDCSSVPCSMPCHRCIDDFDIRSEHMPMFKLNAARMILCEHCGNKRCRHASDHRLLCWRSNEPGQPGSIYE
jgi:hypothetical protein